MPQSVALSSSWLSPKLVGRPTGDDRGNGVYARRPVRPGELLVVWGGTVLDRRQYSHLPPEQNRLVLQIEEDHFLWSVTEGAADWVNHCCEPNAGLSSSVTLVALRAIAAGEEIRYDYCTSDCGDYDEFECLCGAASCRGRVRGDDWTSPELWKRYDGHFAPYLARRIEALRRATAPLTRVPLTRDSLTVRARRARAARGAAPVVFRES